MCGHQWKKQEDVRVCILCGLTVTYDGKYVPDRRLHGVLQRAAAKDKSMKNGKGGKRR